MNNKTVVRLDTPYIAQQAIANQVLLPTTEPSTNAYHNVELLMTVFFRNKVDFGIDIDSIPSRYFKAIKK